MSTNPPQDKISRERLFFLIVGLVAFVIGFLYLSMHGWHGGSANVMLSLIAFLGIAISYLQFFLTFPIFPLHVALSDSGRVTSVSRSASDRWSTRGTKIDNLLGGSSLIGYGIAVMIGGLLLAIYAVICLNQPRTLPPLIAATVLFLIAGVILPFGLLGLHAIQGSAARAASAAGTVLLVSSWLLNDVTCFILLCAIRDSLPAILTLQHVNSFFAAVGDILIAVAILRVKVFPPSTAVVFFCVAFVTFLWDFFPAGTAVLSLNNFAALALAIVYCVLGYKIFDVMRRAKGRGLGPGPDADRTVVGQPGGSSGLRGSGTTRYGPRWGTADHPNRFDENPRGGHPHPDLSGEVAGSCG